MWARGACRKANKSKTQAAFNFKDGYFEPFTKFEDPAYIRTCSGRETRGVSPVLSAAPSGR